MYGTKSLHFPSLRTSRDIFVRRDGGKIFAGAEAEAKKVLAGAAAVAGAGTAVAARNISDGVEDNSLEAKTEEYYKQMFADIDRATACSSNDGTISDNDFIEFHNPRNHSNIKVFAKNNPSLVQVNHHQHTYDPRNVRPDVKIWDLGEYGGLLKATVIANNAHRYIEPIHATNSKIEEFVDGNFVYGTPTLVKNKKLREFVKDFYGNFMSSGSTYYHYQSPLRYTAADEVARISYRNEVTKNKKDRWVPLPKASDSNALYRKTQEYYDQLFKEIDDYLQNKIDIGVVNPYISFDNPRNNMHTKIYPKSAKKVVVVENPRYSQKELHNDMVTIYDYGDNVGLLKATRIKNDCIVDNYHGNSAFEHFDNKTGEFKDGIADLDKIENVSHFIKTFYTGTYSGRYHNEYDKI